MVDTGLEDLAGNHVGQAFDIDVFDHVTEHITTREHRLAAVCGSRFKHSWSPAPSRVNATPE